MQVMFMTHFPFEGSTFMSWCGKIISRTEYKDVVHRYLEMKQGKRVKTHEHGHVVQADNLHGDNWLSFYLSYYWNWIKHGLMNPLSANYYINKYEAEAYANEEKPEYWKNYTKDCIRKYTFKNPKKLYKQIGGTPEKWKAYVKSL
jgi:hypothetical protein